LLPAVPAITGPCCWSVRTGTGGPHADLSVGESTQGVDTICFQSGKVGLHYLDYRGQTIRW
jgi:hypothetical protein